VLLVPEEYDLFLGGGRGGGKSYALAALALRHVEQYRGHARVLYLRKTYKGLADFELICRELFSKVYGPAASYNATEHVWRFGNGAYFELGQIDSAGDYAKVQGRSFSLLMVDEAGQYAEPGTLDMVRSNLRGPRDVPIRMVVAANPGGPGHYWIAKRYVFNAAPWHPFVEEQSKRTFVSCPSTFDGNPFIDGEQYRAQLESSCVGDPELLRAWTEGDWAVARGAYFAAVLDEGRNAVDPWPELPQAMRAGSDGYRNWDGWKLYLAHDYGSSAPSVTYVVAKSPGREGPDGKFYPRDSLVLVDELATVRGEQLNTGLGWTVPVLAEEIRGMCARWRMRSQGVADDAIFAKGGHAAGSIADEFRAFGVHFDPAKKADRLTGWTRMKRLLADAGKPDVPGLYVSRACRYFWATVPSLARDQRRIEDVDSTGPDHAADAARYGCLATERRVIVEPLKI
jgi:hypothetical protein